MSEQDDETTKTGSSSTENPLQPSTPLTITDAHTFLVQCREFLAKEKLASQDEKPRSSEIFLRNLTESDLSLISECIFHAWRKAKEENAKVKPTLNPPKTWPIQLPGNKPLQDEDAMDSFEEAKALEVGAFSQAPDRPLSPDILDLLESEIRVSNVFITDSTQLHKSLNEQVKSDVDKRDKLRPKFLFKAQSWHNLTEEEKEETFQDTTSLYAALERPASMELTCRIFEWSRADLRKRKKLEEQKTLTPSGSKSDEAIALSLPSTARLQKRREFSFWVLKEAKKLYDTLVSEQAGDSDESQNTSRSSNTKDSGDKPLLFPSPSKHAKGRLVNAYSDDTLSEITTISTDSDSSKTKTPEGVKPKTHPPVSTSSVDSTRPPPGSTSSDSTKAPLGTTLTDSTKAPLGTTLTDSTKSSPRKTRHRGGGSSDDSGSGPKRPAL